MVLGRGGLFMELPAVGQLLSKDRLHEVVAAVSGGVMHCHSCDRLPCKRGVGGGFWDILDRRLGASAVRARLSEIRESRLFFLFPQLLACYLLHYLVVGFP